MIFEVQVVDQPILQSLVGIEDGLKIVGDLVELFNADVTVLADAREDLSPNRAQQLVHLFAVGLAHLVQEIGLNGALEAVVGTTDNLHFDVEFVKQVLVEHDL